MNHEPSSSVIKKRHRFAPGGSEPAVSGHFAALLLSGHLPFTDQQGSAKTRPSKQYAVTQVLSLRAASCIMDRPDGPDSWL